MTLLLIGRIKDYKNLKYYDNVTVGTIFVITRFFIRHNPKETFVICHAVGNRCAVDFAEMKIDISLDQALSILASKGFKEIDIELIQLARLYVGVASYKRGARLTDAPEVFDSVTGGQ